MSNGFLRLAEPFGKKLRPVDHDQGDAAFLGRGPGEQRFAGAGRSEEQQTVALRGHLSFGILHPDANMLQQLVLDTLESADVAEAPDREIAQRLARRRAVTLTSA